VYKERTFVLALLTILLLGAACSSSGPDLSQFDQTGPSPDAYDPATATARVFGSISFEGTPPAPAALRVGGSLFCVQNARGLTNKEILIKEGKVQNVMVYVRAGHEGRSYQAPAEPVVLDQQRCEYVPRVVTVMTGQNVRVRNSDDTYHNVRGTTELNKPFNINQPDMGDENTLVFEKPEVPIRIGCDLHAWMKTWVGVFDHPFHTISGESGSYEMRLPPGDYEIVAWHEKFGEKSAKVHVDDGAEAELNFTYTE